MLQRRAFLALGTALTLALSAEANSAGAPHAESIPGAGPGVSTVSAEAHADALQHAAAGPVTPRFRGTVIEVENAAGYSYVQVEMDGRRSVLATTPTDVKPGDHIVWGDSMVMRNFHSRTLDRTFGEIHFVSKVVRADPPAIPEQGVITQISDAGGYSFIEILRNGSSTWLAAPLTAARAGDTVSWDSAYMMRDFKSPSMGRTFEEILFVSRVSVAGSKPGSPGK